MLRQTTSVQSPLSALATRRLFNTVPELVQRMQRKFDEVPGTYLTLAQASRLFGLSPDICRRILQELVAEGTLTQNADLPAPFHGLESVGLYNERIATIAGTEAARRAGLRLAMMATRTAMAAPTR